MPLLVAGVLLGTVVQAEVVIEWVQVGDAGNVGEVAGEGAGGYGPDRTCGAVDHEYRIAKYEVTNGQYIAFLNAVATLGDAAGLYSIEMAVEFGGIDRAGSGTIGDPWVYSLKDDDPNWAARPVCFVSFYDALRFVNWMHNGQPTGAQDKTTTEDGAYDLSLGASVVRKDGARVFLTNEDEWYKAAFYKGGGTEAGYWDFATQSDTLPVAEPPPGRTGLPKSANYEDDETGVAVGPLYYSTPVGAYVHASSAFGTFDQTGNVNEWNETDVNGDGAYRCILGGAWFTWGSSLHAAMRHKGPPTLENRLVGFRLASMPQDRPSDKVVGLRANRAGSSGESATKPGEEVCVTTSGDPARSDDGTVVPLAEVKTVQLTDCIFRITLSFGLRSNTGVLTGPDGVLVVDTGEAPVASQLASVVEALGKSVPRYIINTHPHRDHAGGNDVLGAEATLIHYDNLKQRVSEGVLTLGMEPLKGRSGRTFNTHYSMRFNGEEIRLIPTPGTHSDADLLIHFTRSGVVQTGDLLLTESFPPVPHNVKAYLEILDTIIDVFPSETKFIPGHGRDCGMDYVKRYRATLLETIEVVKKEMKAGKSVAQMQHECVLEKWKSLGNFIPTLGPDYWIRAIHQNYGNYSKDDSSAPTDSDD